MPPYVGMARKQNGGYNASISVLTPIFHLVVNSTRLRSAHWCCPNSTMAPRLLGNVVKVTKLEVVKIEFRHLHVFGANFRLVQNRLKVDVTPISINSVNKIIGWLKLC